MRALDRKLLRDLVRLGPQAIAVALVLASGVATLILAVGAYRSLDETRAAFYERYRFADVFATLKRAPNSLLGRIAELPGVADASARISRLVLLDIEGVSEPATAIALSLPDFGEPKLNLVHLRSGRLPEPGHVEEATVSEAFATAHGFTIGSRFKALLNGRKREIRIVGLALSPEYIYAIGPGDLMPDNRRFAVLWMSERALSSIFDLEGAFNSVSLKLQPKADEGEVIKALDGLLARHGGTGAHGRRDNVSHAFLDAELRQLLALARVIPPVFLLVSAFLVNLILSRLVALEREQIGLLKAIGYDPLPIVAHYVKLVLIIAAVGIAIGSVLGTWFGNGLTRLYGRFFMFPFLVFDRDVDMYVIAALIAAAAAVAGAVRAVAAAYRMPPAVAMQAPAPPRYRKHWIERITVLGAASRLTLMSVRNMLHWPLRAAMTILGVALAVGVLVTSLFSFDSVEFMIDVTFFRGNRQQATINFVEPRPARALEAVRNLPGVLAAEPLRAVPVRLRNGHLERQVSLLGKPAAADLGRVLDAGFNPVVLPDDGILLNTRLAEVLGLRRGDVVEVELLEGRRGTRWVIVSQIIESYFGLTAFMRLEALNRLLLEGPVLSAVHVGYDRAREGTLFTAIKATPAVASIELHRSALSRFRETVGENISMVTSVYIAFAAIIVFGVVYNSARVQLSERARELASLRVLGFTRAEVSRVLLVELAVMVLLAQPLGWLLGHGLAWVTIQSFSSDLYRTPLIIEQATYARATLVAFAAALFSVLLVRRRIDRLDLVGVLKTRD